MNELQQHQTLSKKEGLYGQRMLLMLLRT